ncbi:hypothetical protein SDC9_178910 [bioreactor metagenome]|uniref:Uncharacterized protein n=1 Tax=bioreactor metagenome TaxID=1076179 RepID=A0A645GYU9_9ZZZZ
MDHPVAEVHPGGLATSQQGVEYGCIFSSVMVPGKQKIFSSQSQDSLVIFRQIIIYFVPAIKMIPGQPVVDVVAIFYSRPYRAFGHHLGVFVYQPFFEGDHDGIGMSFPEGRPFIIGEIPVIGLPFHFIEKTDLLKGVFSPGLIIFDRLLKLPADMRPTSKGEYSFFMFVHLVYPVAVRLQGTAEVFQQGQRDFLRP